MYWLCSRSEMAMKQIENGESYLHVSTMEQILATSLISLNKRAGGRYKSYLPEVARKQTENYRSYLYISAME
ncbi:Toxin CaTX-A [Gossypium arboreum]|uniref:Toxin CaTX-A n=1 Tax=Gossypium arboreum TaxID=29729 RepID=A0A0B0P7G7_GOSAR|nr:Toxin CaTX-A [Gossypium arboreum]